MAFQFNNYATNELSKSPINDIISNLFGGYEKGVKASYLQPTLAEQLQKAKLTNQYYGPNMESQIGLRGAHAGLLGEQTKTAHMTNEILPEQLKAQLEGYRLQQAQNQMMNQIIQQRLAGSTQNNMGSGNMPNLGVSNYDPGNGQPPFMQQQSSSMQQPTMQSSPFIQSQSQPFGQPQQGNPFDFSQAPQLTADDIINKKVFNEETFAPRYKAYVDSVAKNMNKKNEEKFKLESKEAYRDYVESSKAQNDLPVLNKALQTAEYMKKIVDSKPGIWGHWLTPGLVPKRMDDPAVGIFQGQLVPLIGEMEKQLSEKGNQQALKTASSKLPSFDDTQQVASGKMVALIDSLQSRIKNTKNLGGGNIVRRGTKRFINKDGHWYEVKRGEF